MRFSITFCQRSHPRNSLPAFLRTAYPRTNVILEAALTAPDPTKRLEASRRKASGKVIFPRIPTNSPVTGMLEPVTLSEVAEIYSFTIIHTSHGVDPTVLIYADFPEGARVLGRLVADVPCTPRIGMQVRAVVQAAGETGVPLYHFEPVTEP